MPIERAEFRDAMARLGAAVNVVTTDGEGGRAGFTASAVCSVTDDPPTLLVCLNRAASSNAVFLRNMVLCVNTLAAPPARAVQRLRRADLGWMARTVSAWAAGAGW
jgi:flavin reductase